MTIRSTVILIVGALLAALGLAGAARAQDSLAVTGRHGGLHFTPAELRAHERAADVTIARDIVFHRAMSYRAVPVAALLAEVGIEPDDYLQARAVDNFSIAIPARLLLSPGALLAVEDAARPWPRLTKGAETYGAGPFYLVWRDGQTVSSEYWVYRLAALALTDSPLKRWPQLGVAAGVPADDPVRHGLDRFVAVCLACHRFSAAGEGDQGPDLGRPMNAVDYFQPAALRKLLRDPDGVRSWPGRKMPAFSPEMLSDGDIDAIVAWLAYKARTR